MKISRSNTIFACLLAGSLAALAAPVFAADDKAPPPPHDQAGKPAGERGPGGPGGGRRMDPAARLQAMAEALSLTQEQKDKILPIIQQFSEKQRAARELPEDQRRAESQKLRAAEHDQIAALLTPEQKTKFEEMRQRGPGGPGGGQGRRERGDAPPPQGDAK